MIVEGTYVSVWDSGREFKSRCTVDFDTQQVVILDIFDTEEDDDHLEDEFVIVGKLRLQVADKGSWDLMGAINQPQMLWY